MPVTILERLEACQPHGVNSLLLNENLESLAHSFRVDQSFELGSSRYSVVLACAGGFQVGKIRVPREGEQEIHVRCEILRAGGAVKIFTCAMAIVSHQGSTHMTIVVELLRFVTVVNCE